MIKIQIKLDISDFDRLCHTSYTTDSAHVIDNDRYEHIKGDQVGFFRLNKKISVHVVGESYLEALAVLQILKSEGHKAVLFWDVAPINDDKHSPCWGYLIFTDMPL